MRVGSLAIVFGALGLWLVTGFNIVEGGVPLIGLQWSTVATFAFFFYLLMVNFQVGGLNTFRQLLGGMSMDLHFMTTLKRREYPQEAATNPWRAVLTSLLVCISALFLFEVIWVFLYDYLQFGSVLWPVYFAKTSFPGILIRNIGLFIMPLVLAWLILTTPIDLTRNRFSVKFRIGGMSTIALLEAIGFWALWITFPHQAVNVATLSSGQVIGPNGGSFSLIHCYIWPSQQFFPQNTYTFYPCALKGVGYTPPEILGFFSADNAVHAVNVLTKFVTFAALCFPFLAFVRKEP